MKSVVTMRENSYVTLGVNRLLSTSGSYSLTTAKRNHCASCRKCSRQVCRSCPVQAEYDRLFDIFCDREEAEQEKRFNDSLTALLTKYSHRKAAVC